MCPQWKFFSWPFVSAALFNFSNGFMCHFMVLNQSHTLTAVQCGVWRHELVQKQTQFLVTAAQSTMWQSRRPPSRAALSLCCKGQKQVQRAAGGGGPMGGAAAQVGTERGRPLANSYAWACPEPWRIKSPGTFPRRSNQCGRDRKIPRGVSHSCHQVVSSLSDRRVNAGQKQPG